VYSALASIMVYKRRFTEYLVVALFLVFILPALLILAASSSQGTLAAWLAYILLVVLRPLHRAPGILALIIKHTPLDTAAKPYAEAPLEAQVSALGVVMVVILGVVILLYSVHLLEKQGTP